MRMGTVFIRMYLKTFRSIFIGHTLVSTENTKMNKTMYSQNPEYIYSVEHKNKLVNFYMLSS